jgi:hypothetical protein
VPIKNSVYVLPAGDQAREDFQWVLREIVEAGGEGSVCEARFVDGLSDGEVRNIFHSVRDADYEQIAADARALGKRRLERKAAERTAREKRGACKSRA